MYLCDDISETLRLSLRVIADRRGISTERSPVEIGRRLQDLSPDELRLGARALQRSEQAQEWLLGRPKVFATLLRGAVEAHPGPPGNVLALLALGLTTEELGLYLPEPLSDAIDYTVHGDRRDRHFIYLNNTAGQAPIYRIRLGELNFRAHASVQSQLIEPLDRKEGTKLPW